jgi:hypothetical protein
VRRPALQAETTDSAESVLRHWGAQAAERKLGRSSENKPFVELEDKRIKINYLCCFIKVYKIILWVDGVI